MFDRVSKFVRVGGGVRIIANETRIVVVGASLRDTLWNSGVSAALRGSSIVGEKDLIVAEVVREGGGEMSPIIKEVDRTIWSARPSGEFRVEARGTFNSLRMPAFIN